MCTSLGSPVPFIGPRSDWSRVIAFAWWSTTEPNTSVFIEDLRENPKTAIEQLARGKDGKYKDLLSNVEDGDTRGAIVNAALNIQQQANDDPTGDYRGFLPFPSRSEAGVLADLDDDKLADLLRKGIAGILEFDDPDNPEQAGLWAQELKEAWKDEEHLKEILQDPANKLINKENLKNILPIPDRPRGLEELKIEKLQQFLADRDNMEHLGGVFLFGS